LRDALIVNPYDIQQLSEAMRQALEMTPSQCRSRMQNMRRTVREHNVYKWASDLLSALVEIRTERGERHEAANPPLVGA
jgi:trehalose-6-phosphate synthase